MNHEPAGADMEVCDPVEAQDGQEREGENGDDEDVEGAEDSGEAQASRKAKQPRMPSAEDRRIHDLTHVPYRCWCEHCVRGQGSEYKHSTVIGPNAGDEVTRVIMDYCFLTEGVKKKSDDHTEEETSTTSLTALVMKETLCGSVWAYALKSKSVGEDPWIADQIMDDLLTIGVGKERIIVKSDQEASIVELQGEIAKRRESFGGTGLENSKVGDSNSNGKIERAIRDVENLIRTLRSALSARIGESVKLSMSIVPWMVRHAAYLITRCRVRAHGKTSMQLMKGRTSLTELIPFGETVMFKVPKTGEVVGSFEDRWESGVWLGCAVRDGMTLVGTATGVYKVGTIKRKADGEQWSKDNVISIVGTPQKPQQGVDNRRITTFAKKKLDDGQQTPVQF